MLQAAQPLTKLLHSLHALVLKSNTVATGQAKTQNTPSCFVPDGQVETHDLEARSILNGEAHLVSQTFDALLVKRSVGQSTLQVRFLKLLKRGVGQLVTQNLLARLVKYDAGH